MVQMGREYIAERGREGKTKKIGCWYEKQISGCKTAEVKLLNRTDAKEERGKSIQMRNLGKNSGVDIKRRKAGDFFVRDLYR